MQVFITFYLVKVKFRVKIKWFFAKLLILTILDAFILFAKLKIGWQVHSAFKEKNPKTYAPKSAPTNNVVGGTSKFSFFEMHKVMYF